MFVITVPSWDGKKSYKVRQAAPSVWVCDCTDHMNRAKGDLRSCKHIALVTKSLLEFSSKAEHSKASSKVLGLD